MTLHDSRQLQAAAFYSSRRPPWGGQIATSVIRLLDRFLDSHLIRENRSPDPKTLRHHRTRMLMEFNTLTETAIAILRQLNNQHADGACSTNQQGVLK
jgi:hypothetical protein